MSEQDEDLIPDNDDIRGRARQAAEQGPDELAEVVGSAIDELAQQFADKMSTLLEEHGGTAGSLPSSPRQFVAGSLFGAVVFALGVLLGRRH